MRSTILAIALATTCLCAPALAQTTPPQESAKPAGMQQNGTMNSDQSTQAGAVQDNATTGQAAPAQGNHPAEPTAAAGQGDAGMNAGASGNASAASGSNVQAPGAASDANASQANAGSGQVQYVTNNDPDLWSAQKLDGVDVYNDQNKKIGDIEDVLVDRDGRVKAVVIGVGGFLGIGQHDVAVSFNSLQWQMNKNDATGAAATGTMGQTTGANVNGTANAPGKDRDAPARAILPGATQETLKNAPEFKYAH